jgi:putative NADH-flavin reductase
VGGAGSLETGPGQRLLDSPDFPPAWKPTALAHARAFEEVYRDIDDLEWTYICPAGQIGPGERTGEFRIGGDQLLVDESGESRISVADYAIAFADELEHAEAVRRRITVAY